MEQLTDSLKSHFPAAITHKYVCDNTIVSMLRMRTQGNWSTQPTTLVNERFVLYTYMYISRIYMYIYYS